MLDLVFPRVTVCLPRGSNTILNIPLQAVKKDNYTGEERDSLLNSFYNIFLKNPNQRYALDLVDLVNKEYLRGLSESQISLPSITGTYTFAIQSSQPSRSIKTPEYGIVTAVGFTLGFTTTIRVFLKMKNPFL